MNSSQTFRLFISSTFSDFKKEREVLQTNVFPKIKEYCSQMGYTFQPIDLRWGINDEAQLDQKTLEMCLEEVRSCKNYPYPNFLVMLGDRYGWVPLPYAIESKEFEKIQNFLKIRKAQDHLKLKYGRLLYYLEKWYQLDENQIPSSYILIERKGYTEDYYYWSKHERELRDILQNTVNELNILEDQKKKYFISATEAEIEEGIIPYIKPTEHQKILIAEKLEKESFDIQKVDPEHVIAFLRKVESSIEDSDMFIGDDQEKALSLKDRVKGVLPVSNVFESDTIQINEKKLDETYLEEFEKNVFDFLKEKVNEQLKNEDRVTELELEKQAQRSFAEQKRKIFVGQTDALEFIDRYIGGDELKPLIIYGASGLGKSSLMAEAIDRSTNNGSPLKLIYRFVGATPISASSKDILTSIFKELNMDIASNNDNKLDITRMLLDEEQETFEQFSYRVCDGIKNMKENIVIFIDAVDQLMNKDKFLWLPNVLPKNVKIIISALDDENYEEDSEYFKTLRSKSNNIYQLKPFSEPESLLNKLLAEEKRTISEKQKKYFLKQYKKVERPLYISIAVQDMKHWESDKEYILADTQRGIIEEFIENLSSLYHHDKDFVQKVLGYIYASRDGLSENEILQLISTDEEFVRKMAPETWHENKTKALPLVIWTRLYTQLKPFLSMKYQDGENLLYLFHREFGDVISELPNQKKEHEAIIKATQALIEKNQDKLFDENRWGKLYADLIIIYNLEYDEKSKLKLFSLFVINLNKRWVFEFIKILHKKGLENYNNKEINKAIMYQRSLLFIAEYYKKGLPDIWSAAYVDVSSSLSGSYFSLNRTTEAIELNEKCLKYIKNLKNISRDRTWKEAYISTLNNLANAYYLINDIDQAIFLEKKSYKLIKTLYNENSKLWLKNYITAINNLAVSYRNQQNIDEALMLEIEALELTTQYYQEDSDEWIKSHSQALSNLARTYNSINQADKALYYEEKNLKILESMYEQRPRFWIEEYTTSLINMGIYYNDCNQVELAIKIEEKCLNILDSPYKNNPDMWVENYTSLCINLALSYRNINIDKSANLEEKNRKKLKILHFKNPDRWGEKYAIVLNNLVSLNAGNQKFYKALEYGFEKLKVLESLCIKNPSSNKDNCIKTYHSLFQLYEKVEDKSRALSFIEEGLKTFEVLCQKDTNFWVESYTNGIMLLSNLYKENEIDELQMNQVINLEKKCYQILKKLYKVDSVVWAKNYINILSFLSISYRMIKNIEEAKKLETENINILKKLFEKDPIQWETMYFKFSKLLNSYNN